MNRTRTKRDQSKNHGMFGSSGVYLQLCVDFCAQHIILLLVLGAVQRKNFQKSENTMEVGGWAQVSLGFFFLEIHPKIALNQH